MGTIPYCFSMFLAICIGLFAVFCIMAGGKRKEEDSFSTKHGVEEAALGFIKTDKTKK